MAFVGKILPVAVLLVLLAVHAANGNFLDYTVTGLRIPEVGQMTHSTASSAAEVLHGALRGAQGYFSNAVDHFGPLPKVFGMTSQNLLNGIAPIGPAAAAAPAAPAAAPAVGEGLI